LTSELVNVFGRHVEGFGDENVFHGHCFYWVDFGV
jgi:hypothetical protein